MIELPDLINIISSIPDKPTVTHLSPLYTKITALLEEEEFDLIDELFLSINADNLPDILMIGLLRLSLTRSSYIDNWTTFRDKCFNVLNNRSPQTAHQTMSGLL